MQFEDVIREGKVLILEYKDRSYSMTTAEIQNNRDLLAALSVTLAEYMSDFQDSFIAGELRRKMGEAKEIDRLMDEKVPANKAAIKAKIAMEENYNLEANAERMFRRAQNMLAAWNQILNTMASRMNYSGSQQK